MFLGGDLSFPGVGEGRLSVDTGRVTLTDESISAHFDNTSTGLCGVMGGRPTRRAFAMELSPLFLGLTESL